jgi:phenylalanyl-tRNA synthetase alpha chain
VEKVELIDEFTHPITQKKSNAYRIIYRHMDRNLTNEEIDKIQEIVRKTFVSTFKVSLR